MLKRMMRRNDWNSRPRVRPGERIGIESCSHNGERRWKNGRSTSISSGLFAIRFLVFFVLSSSSLQLCIFGNPLTFSFSLVEGIRLTRTRLISGIWQRFHRAGSLSLTKPVFAPLISELKVRLYDYVHVYVQEEGSGLWEFLPLVRPFHPFLSPPIIPCSPRPFPPICIPAPSSPLPFPPSSGDDERPLILAWVDTNEDSVILDCWWSWGDRKALKKEVIAWGRRVVGEEEEWRGGGGGKRKWIGGEGEQWNNWGQRVEIFWIEKGRKVELKNGERRGEITEERRIEE